MEGVFAGVAFVAWDLGYSGFSIPQIANGKIVVPCITDLQVFLLEFDDTLNLTQFHYVTNLKGFADNSEKPCPARNHRRV